MVASPFLFLRKIYKGYYERKNSSMVEHQSITVLETEVRILTISLLFFAEK